MNCKILDCTLRDGGYYTEWDYDEGLVHTYLGAFRSLPVQFLELGYRTIAQPGYKGKFNYCPPDFLRHARQQSGKQIAILLNEKEIPIERVGDVLDSCVGGIDLIRIAVDPARFESALKLGEAIRALGFPVAFNVMYMSEWTKHPKLWQLLGELEGMADYLYMVDSFGGVFPEDVKTTIHRIREKSDISLGFHGHNNLELALVNTLTAMESGVAIVDATITGMGRGAGNLRTELLLTVLNAKMGLEVNFNALAKVVDEFEVLQEKHRWGTNLPYMVSGAYSLPQKQVMEWVTKRFYSVNSILRALENQSKGQTDNQQLPILEINTQNIYEDALIIGGGPTAVDHAPAIRKFLASSPGTVVIHASSRNAMSYDGIKNEQFFCLVGNEGYRLESIFHHNREIQGKCILPPFPRVMGTYVPDLMRDRAYELATINFVDNLQDTHTALAIQTARELGISKLWFAGYDGYGGTTMNAQQQDFFMENEFLFSKAKAAGMTLTSLTATRYTQLNQASIYAKI